MTLPTRGEAAALVREALAAMFPRHFPRDAWPPAEGRAASAGGRGASENFFAEARALSPRTAPVNDAHASLAGLPLDEIRALLEGDAQAALDGDPAATSLDEVLLCYPGFLAAAHHRIAHVLWHRGDPLRARLVASVAHAQTGIDIHPGATIGAQFFIDHGTGVVIGETAVVGRRVRLYQGVTLGANRFERGLARHPILEDEVVVYANATILGRITVGRGSVIGGNVWLTKSVPAHARVMQARAQEDRYEEGAGI